MAKEDLTTDELEIYVTKGKGALSNNALERLLSGSNQQSMGINYDDRFSKRADAENERLTKAFTENPVVESVMGFGQGLKDVAPVPFNLLDKLGLYAAENIAGKGIDFDDAGSAAEEVQEGYRIEAPFSNFLGKLTGQVPQFIGGGTALKGVKALAPIAGKGAFNFLKMLARGGAAQTAIGQSERGLEFDPMANLTDIALGGATEGVGPAITGAAKFGGKTGALISDAVKSAGEFPGVKSVADKFGNKRLTRAASEFLKNNSVSSTTDVAKSAQAGMKSVVKQAGKEFGEVKEPIFDRFKKLSISPEKMRREITDILDEFQLVDKKTGNVLDDSLIISSDPRLKGVVNTLKNMLEKVQKNPTLEEFEKFRSQLFAFQKYKGDKIFDKIYTKAKESIDDALEDAFKNPTNISKLEKLGISGLEQFKKLRRTFSKSSSLLGEDMPIGKALGKIPEKSLGDMLEPSQIMDTLEANPAFRTPLRDAVLAKLSGIREKPKALTSFFNKYKDTGVLNKLFDESEIKGFSKYLKKDLVSKSTDFNKPFWKTILGIGPQTITKSSLEQLN